MARCVRVLLAGLLASLAVLVAAPTASAAELGLTCDDLISEETRANLPGSGFVAGTDTTFAGFDGVPREYPGALSCTWGVPQTDNLFSVGVAAVTADQASTEQEALRAQQFTSRESDGGLLFEVDPSLYGYIVAPVALFIDGYWFTASDYALLGDLTSAVLGAGTVTANDDCGPLLSENQRSLLAQNNIGRTNTTVPFQSDAPSDGVFCAWGNTLSLAYAEVTQQQAEALRTAALASGLAVQPDGLLAGGMSAWASEMYFSDGYWFMTYRMTPDIPLDISAIELRDRILGARPAVAVDDPTGAPALLETEPVAATESGPAATPSALSELPPAQSLPWSWGRFAALAGAAIVLTALLVLPGKLVDIALDGNYTRLGLPRLRLPTAPRIGSRRWPIVVGLVVAAAISVFVDPGIVTLDAETARVFASTLVAVCIESVLGLWLVARIARRVDPDSRPSLSFTWNSLVFILLAVAISRASGFEPGMMFGLLIGLSYARDVAPRREHRVVWAEAGIVLATGLLAYAAYSLLFVETDQQTDSVLGVLALFGRETLSALTIATVFALPIVLLPVRGMLGPVLWRHNRLNWFGGYASAVFFLIAIVLPLDDSWSEVGNTLDQWLWLLVVYVAAAVTLWALLTFLPTPKRLRAPDTELQDAG